VRRDVLGELPELTAEEAYVASRIRESRGPDGELTYLGEHAQRIELIGEMPVIDVSDGIQTTVAEAIAAADSA
jgi:hypothetical protein